MLSRSLFRTAARWCLRASAGTAAAASPAAAALVPQAASWSPPSGQAGQLQAHAPIRRGFAALPPTDDGAPVGSGASTVVISGGAPVACEDGLTSDRWLGEMGRGAYTNARTVGRHSIFELDFHMERLAQSIKLMMTEGGGELAGFASPEGVRGLLLPAVRQALLTHREDNPAYEGEIKLAFLVTWGASGGPGGAPLAHVHAAPLGAPALRPVKAMLAGAPRANAEAKDSGWVLERMELERSKPADVNELLLQDAGGAVLEGASSNFFAIISGTVYTAEEGVLHGSVRRAVLEACEEHGVPVVRSPPLASDASDWDGALITSTARLALPLDALVLPGGGERAFPGGEGGAIPLAHKIAGWVDARVAASSRRVLN